MFFRKNPRRNKSSRIFNELIKLLKNEGMSSRILEESLSTSSKISFKEEEEKLTLLVSFERTISKDKRSLEDSSCDNGET